MSNFNDAGVPVVVDSAKVNNIIKAAVGASGAASLIPIPFGDIGPITAAQIVMLMAIFKEYHRPVQENFLAKIVPALVVSQLGKSVAGSLLKMIPGIGSIAGGAVRMGVAMTFTVGLGKIAQQYCERVDPDGDFRDFMKENKDTIMTVGEQFKDNFEDEFKKTETRG